MAEQARKKRIAALAGIVTVFAKREGGEMEFRVKEKRTHRWWVRPWILDKSLPECNTAFKLQMELQKCDPEEYQRMLRVDLDTFNYILDGIHDVIEPQKINYRRVIHADERLSVTLYYLATGSASDCLCRIYRIGRCSAGRIIKSTCTAIHEVFGPQFLAKPQTVDDWRTIVNSFDQRWNYPACLGCVDGKHIQISKPPGSGSHFYNYKGFTSVILLAIVNANYEFVYTHVGTEGTVADGGVWRRTDFLRDLESGKMQLPPDVELKGMNKSVPCHLIGDDAFPMTTRMMKPFAKRLLSDREAVYNYRCSRARRIVENVFGITASRFRVLQTAIHMNPADVNNIVLAIATLHNMLRRVSGASYMGPGSIDYEDNRYTIHPGQWRTDSRQGMLDVQATHARNTTNNAKEIREVLADFFQTPDGRVSWQDECIHNTHEHLLRNIHTAPM